MAVQEIVTDAELKMVLETSKQTREEALRLLELISTSNSSTDAHQASKQQKNLQMHIGQLRGLHRDAMFAARQTKAQTTDSRRQVDELHLQLQNLYYEQRHFIGEIDACESYE